MTAILHCLVHCVPLQQYFLRDIGHNYMSCAIHRKNARGTAGAVCLACELDRLFLRYMDSAAGIELSSAVSSVSPQLLNDDVNVAFQARNDKALAHGEPLLTADMLTAAWKCGGMKHLAGYEQRDAHEFLHGFLDILGKHMRDFRMRVINSINGARAANTYLAADDKVQHGTCNRIWFLFLFKILDLNGMLFLVQMKLNVYLKVLFGLFWYAANVEASAFRRSRS